MKDGYFDIKRLKPLFIVLGCILLIIFIVIIIGFTYKELEKKELAKQVNAQSIYTEKSLEENSLDFSGASVVYNGKKYIRNNYVKAVLCMGVDRAGDFTKTTLAGDAGQSDGLFLLADDTARNQVKVLIIPRDTMTEITVTDTYVGEENGKELGTALDHITMAYSYGDGREKSCDYTVEAVSKLLNGLKIDSYVATNVDIVPKLNDAVDGVTVTVPTEGMETRDPSFIYGEKVKLMGEQAEAFVRYRDINKDNTALLRMNQQKEYILGYFSALVEKSKTDANIVEKLLDIAENDMVTNMYRAQYLNIAVDILASGGLDGDSFWVVPGEGHATDSFDEYYADTDALVPVILDMFYREQTNAQ